MPPKKDIQYLQELAARKGGRCLSIEYSGMNSKYRWECAKGDGWETTANSIQQGHWCQRCAGLVPHDLRWLQSLALKMGGKCLSPEYSGMRSKYLWECSEGDRWKATANNVQQGQWCLLCSGSSQHDLQWLWELAAKMGGKCLSVKYINNWAKYLWECSEGDRWKAPARRIQQGGWCPHCAKGRHTSRGEIELRKFVRQNYPDASENGVKGLLPNKLFELDIWVPSLRKAIEFDGEYYHDRPKSQERDARKDAECVQVGIKLLRVKYWDYVKNTEAVRQRVLNFLKAS